MRKSSIVVLAGAAVVAMSGSGSAQVMGVPGLGDSSQNPQLRSSAIGGATNSVKLNTPASELGFNQPMSAASLSGALDKSRSGSNTNTKLGSPSPAGGDIKLMASPHRSSNLASALKGGTAGSKAAALGDGGTPIDNKNAAALMGGNTLTGTGAPLKADGSLTNTLIR